jgi:2-oxoglutarate dehydrogenase E1 component
MSTFDEIARASPEYVEALYQQFRRDPASVDERWALLFKGYEFGQASGPSDGSRGTRGQAVADLVHGYRELGYLVADVDPLDRGRRSHSLLDLDEFGFRDSDLDREMDCRAFRGLETAPLRDLLAALGRSYCGTLGVEYLSLSDKAQREWIQERVERAGNQPPLTPEERRRILELLVAAEDVRAIPPHEVRGPEALLSGGCRGADPAARCPGGGRGGRRRDEMVMGMPHRGRLNVLAHTLRKPYELILGEFEGSFLPWDITVTATSSTISAIRTTTWRATGRTIHLSMSANPSHLEAINPVVEGIVRAKQAYLADARRKRVVPVLMHGDAAFMGQGSVYETLMLSELPAFTTGGTVHVIVNNQIGFTTDPADYRAARFPSALARVIDAPVFHVNGDEPEAVVQAARLAIGFRQAFGRDVFVDLVCYRRLGHNEGTIPASLSPPSTRGFASIPRWLSSTVAVSRRRGDRWSRASAHPGGRPRSAGPGAGGGARAHAPTEGVRVRRRLAGLTWAGSDWSADTAVKAERLRAVAEVLRHPPAGFSLQARAKRLLDERYQMVERGEGIDWGCAETLAYGTLLLEGFPVRLSGQDTVRGTFSHRHAALFDAETGAAWVPLANLAPDQASFEAVNSPLSEMAVLGFEYGMSSADPRRLVVWEAQFGDFINSAQVIVDQFIAGAESKWQRLSGLTLLLPHGYEGQGPEHSSARLERFLQLCAEDNMQVVNCTTPAQFFHVLRRQMHRQFRKPLIVMSPKSLLRHTRAVSSLSDLTDGASGPCSTTRGCPIPRRWSAC